MSRSKSRRMAAKARKESEDDLPLMITMVGDPEIVRLKWLGVLPPDAMASEREALIGGDDSYHVAAPDEFDGGLPPPHTRRRHRERQALRHDLSRMP